MMRLLLAVVAALAVLTNEQNEDRRSEPVPSTPSRKRVDEKEPENPWPAWKVAILTAALTTCINWVSFYLSEGSKAKWTAYEHKEARYHNLISSMRGTFQNDPLIENPLDANRKFFEEVDLCLMYCSDDVLRATWALIDRAKPENEKVYGANAATGALKNVLHAVRRDMFQELGKKTAITNEEVYTTGLVVMDVRTGMRVSGTPSKAKTSGDPDPSNLPLELTAGERKSK